MVFVSEKGIYWFAKAKNMLLCLNYLCCEIVI